MGTFMGAETPYSFYLSNEAYEQIEFREDMIDEIIDLYEE